MPVGSGSGWIVESCASRSSFPYAALRGLRCLGLQAHQRLRLLGEGPVDAAEVKSNQQADSLTATALTPEAVAAIAEQVSMWVPR